MQDAELNRAPENWPAPPDDRCTLSDAPTTAAAPGKKKKSASVRSRKKLSESLAGVTVAAVAVVMLSNSIPELFGEAPLPGFNRICPICSDTDCNYYSFGERVDGLRISMDGDPVYTNLLDIYDMSGFSHADEEDRQFAGSIRLEDGSRMLCIIERDLCGLLGLGSRWYGFEDNCDLRYPEFEAQTGRFYTVSDGKTGEQHFVYTGILYMPDGSYPNEIPQVLPAYYPPHDSDSVVMEVLAVEHTENYYVIAVTDMGAAVARDTISYVTALPVTTTEQTYPLGKTMMFAEFQYTHRTFNDHVSASTSACYDTMPGIDEEIHFLEMDFYTKSYGIDISTWGSAELMFAAVSWMDVLETWEALNEKAPDSGHQVYFHTLRMDDLEVNGITYHEFAVYSEHGDDAGYYDVWYYYVPAQEETITFVVNDRISHENMEYLIETNRSMVHSGFLEHVLNQITLA